MVDDASQAQAPSVLQVVHAGKSAVQVNPSELIVSFATARPVIDPKTGQIGGQPALEWSTAYAMSATAAEQFHSVLGAALETYRATFGAIPKDPGFKLEQSS